MGDLNALALRGAVRITPEGYYPRDRIGRGEWTKLFALTQDWLDLSGVFFPELSSTVCRTSPKRMVSLSPQGISNSWMVDGT
jgi:hypothetical protein